MMGKTSGGLRVNESVATIQPGAGTASGFDVSVLILTKNEEQNIARCIHSLSACDDIVIIDSYSTDNTVAIAQDNGVRVFQHEFESFAAQRNFGLDNVAFEHQWILHLDADEVMTDALWSEIIQSIRNTQYLAFLVPSKLILGERWLKYSGQYPAYQVRLGKLGALRFKQVGHGQREDLPADRIGTLKNPYLHYNFSKGIDDWIARHNRYSSDEAERIFRPKQADPDEVFIWRGLLGSRIERRRALKSVFYRLPFRGMIKFFYLFVIRRGFMDGRAGLAYCRLMVLYESMIDAKLSVLKATTLEDASQSGALR